MSTNESLSANFPLWSGDTETVALPALGVPGTMALPVTMMAPSTGLTRQAISMIVSNTGPVNVSIGGSLFAASGILLQPGAAITLGLGTGASPVAIDTVGTATLTVLLFS